MWNSAGYAKAADLESGTQLLYPMMLESPELQWSFIRKVYSIIAIQLALTAAVAFVVVTVRPISQFLVSSSAGLAVYLLLIILPALCFLHSYHQRHPVNLILLRLFTASFSFAVGMTCAFTSGNIILEAAILTAVVVVSLTLYTFWAAQRGRDFNFLGPFLLAAIMVLVVFGLIQMLSPLGKISVMIYAGLAAIIFAPRGQLSFAYTYLKLRRMNPRKPFYLNMFKDCERRAMAKLFHHRVEEKRSTPTQSAR